MQLLKAHKTFSGATSFWSHESPSTNSAMRFATFVPSTRPIKQAIIWLSGLTCTEENFIVKSGIQRILADSDCMVIAPDTSPRGFNLAGEHDSYDFGSGAGFYVDATNAGYSQHYRMYSYVLNEVTLLLRDNFDVQEMSLMGHSMGGHGALVLGLRNPNIFKSITAFSPIVNPTHVPWGIKAFNGYLGPRLPSPGAKDAWASYDACELLKSGHRHPETIRLYQGGSDEFLGEQLQPEVFCQLAREVGQSHELQWCEGYDHSYYFVQSFLPEAVGKIISLV